MRVLLIKTSSMGDIIHTLPALTDAGKHLVSVQFDWVVEDLFADIPTWHPLVRQVIPVRLRRWRKNIWLQKTRLELKQLYRRLNQYQYDLILDAQGLLKSAFLTFFAKGVRAGLDRRSAREFLASFAYQRKYPVNFYQHAIVRMRTLFSQAFGYDFKEDAPDFNLDRRQFLPPPKQEKYLVFLHGTTWKTKQWPENYWIQLAKLVASAGFRIKISGGTDEEMQRARRIANQCEAVEVYPHLDIGGMAGLLAHAKAAVAVDTGFGHLAAALNVPTVSLYGSTNPAYTGALGKHSIHLAADFPCAPCLNRTCKYKGIASVQPACFSSISPAQVWKAVMQLI